MEYKILNAADYGVPQKRRRVFFLATRKDLKGKAFFPNETHGKNLSPYITVMETMGHLPPVRAGETWGKEMFHPYGYNPQPNLIICPACLKYNRKERAACHDCGYSLTEYSISGGVLHIPGAGVLIDTKKTVDNEKLRKDYQTDLKNVIAEKNSE